MMIDRSCVICKKGFSVHPYRDKTAKCCSKECVVKYRLLIVGSPAKGRKLTEYQKEKIRQAHLGKPSWNKGLKGYLSGEKNNKWKGDSAKYGSMHSWVRKHKGRPVECMICNKKNDSRGAVHWSNIDHKYRRNLDDYAPLCPKCHKKYDLENGLCTR